ncbi:MAG: hypothetical protein ABL909_06125 [Sphingopyxis sp.]
MTKICLHAIILVAISLSASGCDWASSSSADTNMRNVEILPGTASDEMITLDQANGDGTAIDTSVAIGPAPPAAASNGDNDAPTPAANNAAEEPKGDTSNNGDVVIRPPSGGAEQSGPATKN